MTASSIPTALADRDGLAVIGRTIHDLRGIRFEEGTGGAAPEALRQTRLLSLRS